jgi:hypothetical protein
MVRSSTPDENGSQVPPRSLTSDLLVTARDARAFSWKRVFRGLACGLSVCWLLLFYVSGAAMNPTHTPLRAKAVNTAVTIISVLPILLVLRGRLRYILVALLLFVVSWTLWSYWIHLERL